MDVKACVKVFEGTLLGQSGICDLNEAPPAIQAPRRPRYPRFRAGVPAVEQLDGDGDRVLIRNSAGFKGSGRSHAGCWSSPAGRTS